MLRKVFFTTLKRCYYRERYTSGNWFVKQHIVFLNVKVLPKITIFNILLKSIIIKKIQ